VGKTFLDDLGDHNPARFTAILRRDQEGDYRKVKAPLPIIPPINSFSRGGPIHGGKKKKKKSYRGKKRQPARRAVHRMTKKDENFWGGGGTELGFS